MPSLASNRKIHHDYSIEDSLEAGLVLSGHEVKSIRGGNVSLSGAYVTVRGNEVWLRNAYVGKYKHAANLDGIDESRERKLLLNRKEILNLQELSKAQGLALVPLEIYTKKGLIKIKIGIAKGKKKFDKRETIKKKELKRTLGRISREKI